MATAEVIDPEKEKAKQAIAEVKSRRDRVESERRARAEAQAMEAELAAEQMKLDNELALDAAEREFGPLGKLIAAVDTDFGVVIVKRAHPATFKKFMDQGKSDTAALDKLVRPSLVYPSVEAYERIVEAQPASLVRFADAVSVLAGVRREELSAKP